MKLLFKALVGVCEARLRELQTSQIYISLQNAFNRHLWAIHWTTCSYIEPCSIADTARHWIYVVQYVVRAPRVIWLEMG
jgi:hypothetical protein